MRTRSARNRNRVVYVLTLFGMHRSLPNNIVRGWHASRANVARVRSLRSSLFGFGFRLPPVVVPQASSRKCVEGSGEPWLHSPFSAWWSGHRPCCRASDYRRKLRCRLVRQRSSNRPAACQKVSGCFCAPFGPPWGGSKKAQKSALFDFCGVKSRGSGGAPPTHLILLRNQRRSRPAPELRSGARAAGH